MVTMRATSEAFAQLPLSSGSTSSNGFMPAICGEHVARLVHDHQQRAPRIPTMNANTMSLEKL